MGQEFTIEEIEKAVAESGKNPEYGDGFWEARGCDIAAFLLKKLKELAGLTDEQLKNVLKEP